MAPASNSFDSPFPASLQRVAQTAATYGFDFVDDVHSLVDEPAYVPKQINPRVKQLAVTGLIFFGTLISTLGKLAYEVEAVGRDGSTHPFGKPWFLVLLMFAGMSVNLPLSLFLDLVRNLRHRSKYIARLVARSSSRRRRPTYEPYQPLYAPLLQLDADDDEVHQVPRGLPSPFAPSSQASTLRFRLLDKQLLLLAVPTLFDLAGAALLNVGLLAVTASAMQMLRQSLLLFAALLGVCLWGKRLNSYHKMGLIGCTTGLMMVAAAALASGFGGSTATSSRGTMAAGIGLVLASQMLAAGQLLVDQGWYYSRLQLSPLKVVGCEGLLGFVLTLCVVLPVAQVSAAPEGWGLSEDSWDSLVMLRSRPLLQLLLLAYTGSLAAYNICGMVTAGELSAVDTALLQAVRTLFVWILNLLIYTLVDVNSQLPGEPWLAWSFLQAAGFLILVLAAVTYSKGDNERQRRQLQDEAALIMLDRPPSVAGSLASGAHAAASSRRFTAHMDIDAAAYLRSFARDSFRNQRERERLYGITPVPSLRQMTPPTAGSGPLGALALGRQRSGGWDGGVGLAETADGSFSRAAEKGEADIKRRLALAQNLWDSISPEQRQQLLTVPLQDLQQRVQQLPQLLPHKCLVALNLALQQDDAFEDRTRTLFDSLDERITAVVRKHRENRARLGPGSSRAGASNAGLLDDVCRIIDHLAQEHPALQQAVLEPVGEYTWQHLPSHPSPQNNNKTKQLRASLYTADQRALRASVLSGADLQASSSKQWATPQLDKLPTDALVNIAAYLWEQVGWLYNICCVKDEPAAVAAAGGGSAAAAGAGGIAEAAADPAAADDAAFRSETAAALEPSLVCLTADGRCMALSQECLQEAGALQQEDRPSRLLEWVYEETSTCNSAVSHCPNELYTMCTAERVTQHVDRCISGQDDLWQRIEDTQRHQQLTSSGQRAEPCVYCLHLESVAVRRTEALQQLRQQWPALQAELNAPGLTQETAPHDLIEALLQWQAVLVSALLHNTAQQLRNTSARLAEKDKQLMVQTWRSAHLQRPVDPKHSPSKSQLEHVAVLQQQLQQTAEATATLKVVAKFGSFDAVRREGGARVQFVLNELDAQYLQLQQQFEEGQKALHVLWQLLYAQAPNKQDQRKKKGNGKGKQKRKDTIKVRMKRSASSRGEHSKPKLLEVKRRNPSSLRFALTAVPVKLLFMMLVLALFCYASASAMQLRTHTAALGYNLLSTTPDPCPVPPPLLQWVHTARLALNNYSRPNPLPGSATGEPDNFGVRNSTQLCTNHVASTFYAAATRGIVLLEPFGGLCAGLEMALRNGTGIKQYYYLDTNPASRQIAAHRLQQLMALYPLLLPAGAVQNAFSMPQDIRQLTTSDLIAAGASMPKHPWLVVAGWPCQDLSQAGSGAGLQARTSACAGSAQACMRAAARAAPSAGSRCRPWCACTMCDAAQLHQQPSFSSHVSCVKIYMLPESPASAATSGSAVPQCYMRLA
ncbi:hypothetical protein COO60DRAFT_1625484 [Scenedesmus sp. NREL 46B-D3]|nr:hypothetical protein COO60DRAFT_1625484 [Scenedesmus sp. NREL 46B-D3]